MNPHGLLDRRQGGILLHPTSLPGPYGAGELGGDARRFVRALRAMGQRLWQILPLGPTGYGDSPYQSLSTFAGNPLLISLERLAADGLLDADPAAAFGDLPRDAIDFGPVIERRRRLLDRACDRFAARARPSALTAYAAFRRRHAAWLEDYALFAAAREAHGFRPWTQWAPGLAAREPAALAGAARELAGRVEAARLRQFLFHRHWSALRAYAHRHGIGLVGDLPLFVAHDSADVWARPDLFHLDAGGSPTLVAGVPPDYFSETGQRWGNPLYRWDRHAAGGYAWWIARMRRALGQVDAVRLDHFRGFEACWEIPASAPTAAGGRWVPGPGAALLGALREALGSLPVIAEDLGVITPPVEKLRDRFRLPGMMIVQFETGALRAKGARRLSHCRRRLVIYTGTHDNDTLRGWLEGGPARFDRRTDAQREADREAARVLASGAAPDLAGAVIERTLRSAARTAILPLQDVLGLGSEARMNVPGTTSGNWRWRFRWEQLTEARAAGLAALTRRARRA